MVGGGAAFIQSPSATKLLNALDYFEYFFIHFVAVENLPPFPKIYVL